MKHLLASVAATTILAMTIAHPASAEDIQLMEGVTQRAGDNPLSEAGKYKKDCPWVIGMSHFGVNANTWTVQVAHESEGAAKKNSCIEKFILLDAGFDQGVIIASPASLMALLKAASYGWRQEAIAENAREISMLGQELHARLGTLAEHFSRIGKGLASATNAYNDAIASFETRVLSSARKFKSLGATSQEAEIIELRAIEGGARKLQNNLFEGDGK